MNEQTRVTIDGKSYPVGHKHGLPQVKTDGGLGKTRFREYRDCTIRALALSAGIEYSTAHRIGRDAGRKRRCGFYADRLLAQAEKSNIFYKEIISNTSAPVTIEEFIRSNPTGKFYCSRSGHSFAIVDGIILDNVRNTQRQKIKQAWRLVETQENNACQPALDYVI